MRNPFRIFLVVLLIFLVLGLVDHRNFVEIPVRLQGRSVLYQVVFYANYIGLLLSMLVFLSVKSPLIRYVFISVLFLTVAITLATEIAHGDVFGKVEANILFSEFQFAGEAAGTFFYQYMKGISIALAVTLLVGFLAFRYLPRINNWYALVPLVFIANAVKTNYSSHSWHSLYPSVYNVPIIATDAFLSIPRFGARKVPFLQPVNHGQYKHIFLIVDESVRGDMLGINQGPLPTTPFLEEIKGAYINYGIASSAAHYSMGSNIILQSGLRADQIPDVKLLFGTNPNIFQYSKRAGYATYFIDGQNKLSIPQNGMTNHDFKNIDTYIQIQKTNPGSKWYEVDSAMVTYIKEILEKPENTFTYINKAGCHFAYNHFYPPNQEIFTPAYRSGKAWTNPQTLLNTYGNSILWSVDAFFKKLFPLTQGKDAIIIYTSDHGVTLLEKGRPIQDTDPRNPLPYRANVPLLVFDGGLHKEFFSNAAFNKDKLSHFSIFPTALFLMGYDSLQVTKLYGKNFLMPMEKNRRIFFSGTLYDPANCFANYFE